MHNYIDTINEITTLLGVWQAGLVYLFALINLVFFGMLSMYLFLLVLLLVSRVLRVLKVGWIALYHLIFLGLFLMYYYFFKSHCPPQRIKQLMVDHGVLLDFVFMLNSLQFIKTYAEQFVGFVLVRFRSQTNALQSHMFRLLRTNVFLKLYFFLIRWVFRRLWLLTNGFLIYAVNYLNMLWGLIKNFSQLGFKTISDEGFEDKNSSLRAPISKDPFIGQRFFVFLMSSFFMVIVNVVIFSFKGYIRAKGIFLSNNLILSDAVKAHYWSMNRASSTNGSETRFFLGLLEIVSSILALLGALVLKARIYLRDKSVWLAQIVISMVLPFIKKFIIFVLVINFLSFLTSPEFLGYVTYKFADLIISLGGLYSWAWERGLVVKLTNLPYDTATLWDVISIWSSRVLSFVTFKHFLLAPLHEAFFFGHKGLYFYVTSLVYLVISPVTLCFQWALVIVILLAMHLFSVIYGVFLMAVFYAAKLSCLFGPVILVFYDLGYLLMHSFLCILGHMNIVNLCCGLIGLSESVMVSVLDFLSFMYVSNYFFQIYWRPRALPSFLSPFKRTKLTAPDDVVYENIWHFPWAERTDKREYYSQFLKNRRKSNDPLTDNSWDSHSSKELFRRLRNMRYASIYDHYVGLPEDKRTLIARELIWLRQGLNKLSQEDPSVYLVLFEDLIKSRGLGNSTYYYLRNMFLRYDIAFDAQRILDEYYVLQKDTMEDDDDWFSDRESYKDYSSWRVEMDQILMEQKKADEGNSNEDESEDAVYDSLVYNSPAELFIDDENLFDHELEYCHGEQLYEILEYHNLSYMHFNGFMLNKPDGDLSGGKMAFFEKQDDESLDTFHETLDSLNSWTFVVCIVIAGCLQLLMPLVKYQSLQWFLTLTMEPQGLIFDIFSPGLFYGIWTLRDTWNRNIDEACQSSLADIKFPEDVKDLADFDYGDRWNIERIYDPLTELTSFWHSIPVSTDQAIYFTRGSSVAYFDSTNFKDLLISLCAYCWFTIQENLVIFLFVLVLVVRLYFLYAQIHCITKRPLFIINFQKTSNFRYSLLSPFYGLIRNTNFFNHFKFHKRNKKQ